MSKKEYKFNDDELHLLASIEKLIIKETKGDPETFQLKFHFRNLQLHKHSISISIDGNYVLSFCQWKSKEDVLPKEYAYVDYYGGCWEVYGYEKLFNDTIRFSTSLEETLKVVLSEIKRQSPLLKKRKLLNKKIEKIESELDSNLEELNYEK